LLVTIATLFHAEVMLHCGRNDVSRSLLSAVFPPLGDHPPDMSARYERAVACVLAAEGNIDNAVLHRDRSRRILESLQNKPELIDLDYSWEEAKKLGRPSEQHSTPIRTSANLIHNIATLVIHAGRSNLIATGLIQILEQADCVSGAVATARG